VPVAGLLKTMVFLKKNFGFLVFLFFYGFYGFLVLFGFNFASHGRTVGPVGW
jgi:hypothetical protein